MLSYYAIGLMSGTSLDGVDICYVKFTKEASWKFKILFSETIEYADKWLHQLKNAIYLPSEDLLELNITYGAYLGEKIKEFRTKYQIHKIDIIASHGHTIFHQPNRKFTFQIGDGRAIKIKNNFPIAYDFRSQDVILGGNGAPLVPIGDELLFDEYQSCLNLGGFSNISFRQQNQRIAFDICPVNIVLNHYAQQLGLNYDNEGKIAELGNINTTVLEQLNQLPFYEQKSPKSLGIEWVIQYIFPLLNILSPQSAIATFTRHITEQIQKVLDKYQLSNCLITGGGAYNTFLIHQLKEQTKTKIIVPEPNIIDFKEALIFALMGVLKLRNEINVLSSATGSTKDHSGGLLI